MPTDLLVIYRYTAGDNGKGRPEYFSKRLALESFRCAVESSNSRVRVVFIIDGKVERPVLAAMQSIGDVHIGSFGSNRRSYLEQLRFVVNGRDVAPHVWFAEDDYLYAEGVFDELLEMARFTDYFALSGPTDVSRLEAGAAQREVPLPELSPALASAVDARGWRRISSTTSTFGGRTDCIRQDARLLATCPWSGAAWDRTTCLALQGVRPYPWRHILSDLRVASTPQRLWRARVVWRLVTRVACNVVSIRRADRRRTLLAPIKPRIAHMEVPFEQDEVEWNEFGKSLLDATEGVDRSR